MTIATAPLNPRRPDFRERVSAWFQYRLNGPTSVLASAHRATWGRRCTVIAVTGSFAKTTTARAIAAILGESTERENLPNCFSRLYTQLIRGTSTRSAIVLEVGVGQPNQMRRYAQVLRPQIAVVTTVGWEYEKFFPDALEGIRREKAELVRGLVPGDVAVLNRDDPNVMWMAARTRARVLTFGRHEDADVALVDFQTDLSGTQMRIRMDGKVHELRTQLIGSVSIMPILAALAASRAAGIDADRALAALATLPPSKRRLEPVVLPSGATVLLDDYKGTYAAAHAAMDTLAEVPAVRRLAVLGNIPQSTPDPKPPIYRELGRHAGRVFERVVLLHLDDEAFTAYRQGLMESGMDENRITRVASVYEAAGLLRRELRPGDVLLIKAHFFDQASRIMLLLRDVPVRCGLRYCLVRSSQWCDQCPMVFRNLT